VIWAIAAHQKFNIYYTNMDYTIKFTNRAFQKISLYIDKASGEISGLGKITHDREHSEIIVEDLVLLNQKNTGSSTEIDQDALAKFYDNLMEKGENTAEWKLWWHSHADMTVFWSGTDTNTIEDFDTEQDTNNFFLSIVGNKKGEFKCRLDAFRPFKYTLEDIPWDIQYDKDLEEEITKEIAEKTSVEVHVRNKSFKEKKYFEDYDDDYPYCRGYQKGYQQGYIYDEQTGLWIPPKNESIEEDSLCSNPTDLEKLKQYYYAEYKDSGKKPYSDAEMDEFKDIYGDEIDLLFYKGKNDFWFPKRPKNEVTRGKKKKKLKKQIDMINHGLVFKNNKDLN